MTTRLQGKRYDSRQRQTVNKQLTQITSKIHKRITALERSVRKLLEGSNMFDGTNLTLIADVDQDT